MLFLLWKIEDKLVKMLLFVKLNYLKGKLINMLVKIYIVEN